MSGSQIIRNELDLDSPTFMRCVIGILVKRLGADVTITQAEFDAIQRTRLLDDFDIDPKTKAPFYRLRVKTGGH